MDSLPRSSPKVLRRLRCLWIYSKGCPAVLRVGVQARRLQPRCGDGRLRTWPTSLEYALVRIVAASRAALVEIAFPDGSNGFDADHAVVAVASPSRPACPL